MKKRGVFAWCWHITHAGQNMPSLSGHSPLARRRVVFPPITSTLYLTVIRNRHQTVSRTYRMHTRCKSPLIYEYNAYEEEGGRSRLEGKKKNKEYGEKGIGKK